MSYDHNGRYWKNQPQHQTALSYIFVHNYMLCCILLLGDSQASEFYVPTFRITLFHLHKSCEFLFTSRMKMEQSVPKRRHIKFRHQGITQKKEYNVQNTAQNLYIVCILATRHPDDGDVSDRNMLLKNNNTWFNVFINVHLLGCRRSTNHSQMRGRGTRRVP